MSSQLIESRNIINRNTISKISKYFSYSSEFILRGIEMKPPGLKSLLGRGTNETPVGLKIIPQADHYETLVGFHFETPMGLLKGPGGIKPLWV